MEGSVVNRQVERADHAHKGWRKGVANTYC